MEYLDLVPAIGEGSEAKLTVVPLSFHRGESLIWVGYDTTPVSCTLTDKLTHTDCLITADTWEQLRATREADGEVRFQAVEPRKQRIEKGCGNKPVRWPEPHDAHTRDV